MEFLQQLEQLGFIVWVRESGSLWGFAAFLFAHTLGLSTLAGVNATIDLRLLGFAPRMPLAPMVRLFPLMWAAFAVTVTSGLVLLLTDTDKLTTSVFLVKITFVVLAAITLRQIRARIFGNPQIDSGPLPSTARVLAITSLACWLGATTAGRLMAYLSSGF
jgi:hypothetical protein